MMRKPSARASSMARVMSLAATPVPRNNLGHEGMVEVAQVWRRHPIGHLGGLAAVETNEISAIGAVGFVRDGKIFTHVRAPQIDASPKG